MRKNTVCSQAFALSQGKQGEEQLNPKYAQTQSEWVKAPSNTAHSTGTGSPVSDVRRSTWKYVHIISSP